MAEGKKIHFYQDKAGEHRWSVYAPNGRIVADSGEGYHNYADCEKEANELFPNMERITGAKPGQNRV